MRLLTLFLICGFANGVIQAKSKIESDILVILPAGVPVVSEGKPFELQLQLQNSLEEDVRINAWRPMGEEQLSMKVRPLVGEGMVPVYADRLKCTFVNRASGKKYTQDVLFPFDGVIAKGGVVRVAFQLVAPQNPGRYRLSVTRIPDERAGQFLIPGKPRGVREAEVADAKIDELIVGRPVRQASTKR